MNVAKHTLLLLIACCQSLLGAVDVVEHVRAHPAGDVPFSLDRSVFATDTRDLPIGVFDSGIGGLTVLEALLTLDVFHNETMKPGADGVPDFAGERFQYFGDQANMPYGNYSSAGRTDYLRELILKDAIFLLGKRWFDPEAGAFRQDKPPVKALVIACNTATAYGIDDLREALKAWELPVIVVGVVEAGARGVLAGHDQGAVGVLATVGTCASGAYPRVIGQTLGLAGRSVPLVTQQGSPNLAGVIEGDPSFPETVPERCAVDARELLLTHAQSVGAAPLSTVVLGCTHFPLVQEEIDRAFAALRAQPQFRPLLAETLRYVNPAEWTARELFRELAAARLRAREAHGADRFYLSIPHPLRRDLPLTADGGLEKDFKYGRQPGRLEVEDTVNVPMTRARIPATTRALIQRRLPEVWRRLAE
ncbi:MAG: aspartate/glutamate racemase family protein [Prosthecobacter sp.]|nr:aspartate/glutamate racemase family protein [Prosthecobacter sp.]